MTFLALRLLHFFGLALWFGATATTGIGLEHALEHDRDGLSARMARGGSLGMLGGLATMGSGLAMVYWMGGQVPWPIHAGLALSLLLAVIGGAGIGRTWGMLASSLGRGASVGECEPLLARLRLAVWAFRAVWATVLVLMVFRHWL